MVDEAVGAVLLCGSLACVGAATFGRRHRVAAALLAAALAVAAADAFGAPDSLQIVACGLGIAGALAMVIDRLGRPLRLSWLDFLMGGCAVGALAVTTGAEASAALSAAGVAAALGAARWRVSGGFVCALVGLIALGKLPALAAPLFGAAAYWLTEPEPAADKEFNPVVLAAILAYMTTVLTLLVVGQFVSLPPVAAFARDAHRSRPGWPGPGSRSWIACA